MSDVSILNIRLSKMNLTDSQSEKILKYIEFLLKTNKRISLTSVNNLSDWFTSHVEDSIKAFQAFNSMRADFFVDAGSGNGLPGIIFGVLSDLPFILCDVDARKCEFLRIVCHRLELAGEVYCGPIEDLATDKNNRRVYIYRGLGPDSILVSHFDKSRHAGHFRFMSSDQKPLFDGSNVESYKLSDKSSRFLEVFPVK